ncbi:MAG: glycosyltransferase family 2 protein [Methanosarcinaceae archaeon]
MATSLSETNAPLISIVISCRNEENYIGKCFDSILANDYPQDRIEVLAVDGQSDDATRDIVQYYTQKYGYFRLLDNPQKVTPAAMNIGIKNAQGDVVILVNAHSTLDRNFLKLNIEYLQKTGASAVGGMLKTKNEKKSIVAQSIPLAADSLFGTGGRRYRNRTTDGFVQDTLPYCAYPRATFQKYGYIDEELIRDQDEEFNYRILTKGGKIFFTPKIKSSLYIRPSLKKLWRQHFQYGFFKPLVAQKVGTALTWRQLIPAAFVGSLLFTGFGAIWFPFLRWTALSIFGLYTGVSLLSSLIIALKHNIKYIFTLPIIFPTLHWSYGWGYLRGIVSFVIFQRNKQQDVPLSR